MRPPGPLEIGLVVLIILIVFGVGKLPQVTEAVGKGAGKLASVFRRKKAGGAEDDDTKTVKKKKKVIKKLD
ncbi:MAG: twin-arginine translocase TatA/TatE family subunit [Dehalococcoidales bacterium]|jgi:sec-independent protein translocase protein TatA|nr:twin-arginine translocase TatA/TatE family subunit [Dehalococcoidales bacterium]MDD3265035.1 twin-arginine translocase TatA/TatE family subunit [Dehalococcoidales bacterium]MDD4322283.1 twin-arginine translocase TatA/TatE family subunit [Dehalococcoidales bacterium]MDD4794349.1 twin-arginine translocase TatA/TatE family subunit [Dehalococcoidales bacterium]MDD5122576.1 twin-arginine translocase TatA/TatE family subunit [Dehalococcoidales bacterium]